MLTGPRNGVTCGSFWSDGRGRLACRSERLGRTERSSRSGNRFTSPFLAPRAPRSPRSLSLRGVPSRSPSRLGRAPRSTTPEGLASTAPARPVETGLSGRRLSRVFQIRERRNSVSSGRPGVRSAAPVLRCGKSGAATVPSRRAKVRRSVGSRGAPFVPPAIGRLRSRRGLIGTSAKGSVLTTFRPRRSSRGCGRGLRPPKSRLGIEVTPPQCPG